MPEPTTCRHCGKRIVPTNDWLNRPSWTHQPAGASFQDGQHRYCHTTAAAPPVEIERACGLCRRYGHRDEDCPSNVVIEARWDPEPGGSDA